MVGVKLTGDVRIEYHDVGLVIMMLVVVVGWGGGGERW